MPTRVTPPLALFIPISLALSVGLDDSLAALRAHAFAADRTLDMTAYDIVNRTLPTADLAPDTNS